MNTKTSRRPKKVPRRIAVAYRRVSTTAERQDLGAEAQRSAIESWAAREKVEIAAWYLDEVSGGAPLDEREGLLDALAAVATHRAQFLVCSTLDRFSRDPASAALAEAELQRAGAALAFADGSGDGHDPTAELVRAIRVAVGRFERKMIGRRIAAALAVKRERGEMTGAPPYGFRAVDGPMRHGKDNVARPVKVLERCPEEQAVLARARELYAVEGVSLRAVIAQLASEGRLNRKGRPFGLEELSKMLKGSDR